MLKPCRLLLLQVTLRLSYHIVTASLCLGGSDIFAVIRENSPMGQFIANLSVTAEPGSNGFRICVTGKNADWFFLDGRTIRLNSSTSKVLDREVQGSLLIAELTCYEEDVIQSQYRILVQILNENDNEPKFQLETTQPVYINELTSVNSVVFTVKAVDADGDTITYIIDQSSPDSSYFRIDLPNSGSVVLDKPLDYETKTHLQLLIWATEANTLEKFNTSTSLTINIQDGDDQYPHFLPCTPVSADVPVCTSPVYSANITEKHQSLILVFSPGPIRAEDGDRGLDSPLIYSILSGGDQGRFVINNRTGEIRLTRAVNDRRQTPSFRLSIMASQLDDPLKYSVASALIRVLGENRFPLVFNTTTYKGFVTPSSSPATIVSTYGNQVLLMQVMDQDFSDGLNPNVQYSLRPSSGLYHITREGVLIARTDRVHTFDRHILQVIARDEESGEEVSASVDIEVLQRGQAVPRGTFNDQQQFGDVDTQMAGGIAAGFLLVFVAGALFLLLRTIRRKNRREPTDHSSVSLGKPPKEMNRQSGHFHGQQGVYTRRESLIPSSVSTDISIGGVSRNLYPVVSRSEDLTEAVKSSMRATGADGSNVTEEMQQSSAFRDSVQGEDITGQGNDPYRTMLATIYAESSSEEGQ
ncbi:cadherin-related family member 5 isoform X2 [Sphaeramia orbicularis]|uniref:cadherin-related family member 5 isoform X2 n=1 Tax=Sphaeramia orbicularis TaxID=375764 RepID=UPI00117F4ED7|nr:cadherin-related family member 5-like isoform X2 [Sphaeramia orbicularis]XP_030004678.1 cadherin-related family member 5-like isoform X2 [Sphaeramia orbicularis]